MKKKVKYICAGYDDKQFKRHVYELDDCDCIHCCGHKTCRNCGETKDI